VAHFDDAAAEFAHQLRQPLSTLETLTGYLELITPEEPRIREQLLRMHSEIGRADQILIDGLRALRGYLPLQGAPGLPENTPAPPSEEKPQLLARPRTSTAMAPVTN